jgi:hypothetical protein
MTTRSPEHGEIPRPVGDEDARFEAVVGWRSWVAAPAGGAWRLWSATRPAAWPVRRPAVATCARCQEPPGDGCDCGVHALREPDGAAAGAPADASLGWNTLLTVIGRVVLFGRVQEHEHGWRGERAYPAHLYVVGAPSGHEEMVARAVASLGDYEVPVERLDAPLRAGVAAAAR